FRCTLLRPTLPGSTRWRSSSTELPNRPFAAGRFATLKNWWRKSTPSCKPPTPPPDPLFGPPPPTRSWLRSNDYVNVFPGRHTSLPFADRVKVSEGAERVYILARVPDLSRATGHSGCTVSFGVGLQTEMVNPAVFCSPIEVWFEDFDIDRQCWS